MKFLLNVICDITILGYGHSFKKNNKSVLNYINFKENTVTPRLLFILGLWTLDSGLWMLDSEPWTLDSGLWKLDFGR